MAPLTASRAATAPAVSRAAGKTAAICDTQPVTAEGIRNLLSGAGDLHFLLAAPSLSQVLDAARLHRPSVLMIDKGFGIQTIMESLGEASQLFIVISGVAVTEAEALRFLQCGARGILRKTVAVPVVLACLRNVAEGRTWMEDSVFRDNLHSERDPRAAGCWSWSNRACRTRRSPTNWESARERSRFT
jgi:DNA-binding NarL/FixJ family response regulator